ncbi:oxidoreductase [Phaeobacter gallaeciensis]|uniref:Oxidoreductase n=1 Tax=Phaeobacter gallaeciensis TaxID=60890 RepID=A0A1B0ZX57_9RHOB|nr:MULTISPECIES: Gfo/Idh/MocA family oxidoreductase [Phaeobacter]MEE2632840.1 Gfo/Idh/MocA family oxidoreductase [Pseudomonadota bacterium]ANP38745.1 oxidoreductase [Phaeobacter gallaeciensis]MDE4061791.1 Gfo/Idh/MocA family oxidoreductase [Phaeobacter gallaeciensis]MDE4124811.1 Gfo/Idh/MocA family oxidoreductase [Phaeobacter gallaeciensis]MDE4129262.1 Gfo/Idh/MocA family oxidoreductase [Phaeobacter gallaeciensis]
MAVKTAVIGLGIMGQRMLEQLILHKDYTPVALWDPSADACAAAQALAPEAEVTGSPEAAIAAADLVYLACPPVPRKAYALAAAAAGKAVFLEKPLGVDLAESEALVAGLKASGVPAAVNFTQAAGAALTDISSAALAGEMGDLVGVDMVVTYAAWPRAWQQAADWLRFRAEGGMTREVLSHFLFFTQRIFGPLTVSWAQPSYPGDPALCETALLARLENEEGLPVSILASVGGAQPDRQEFTIKGRKASHRVSNFSDHAISEGGDFVPVPQPPADRRTVALQAQLDDFLLCRAGKPHRLATPQEALEVQRLVEEMLGGKG